MGGALVLLCGDFWQILPVIPKSTPADESNACLKYSMLWRFVEHVTLRKNMRDMTVDANAQRFIDKLLDIGAGRIAVDASGMIDYSADFCWLVPSIDSLIASVYPGLLQNYTESDWLKERVILAPKNEQVREINNH